MRRAWVASFVAVGLGLVVPPGAPAAPIDGIHNIQHVVVIMQENRSFDQYFGTYPGANGIPAGVCEPDPLNGGCVAPFHDPNDENYGGPHGHGSFKADLDGGKMDGFVGQAEKGSKCRRTEPDCSPCTERLEREVHRRDGLSRRARDPQLLGVCAELRAAGRHVRAELLLELARAPVRGLGVVGDVLELERPDVVHQRDRRAAQSGHGFDSLHTNICCRGRTSPTCCTSMA